MKNIIILIIIIAAAVVAYNHFHSSNSNLPPDEQAVADLDTAFDSMSREFQQEIKSSAASGMDTTSGIEAALGDLERIEKKLKSIEGTLTTDSAKTRAQKLKAKIAEFKRKFGT